jgi:small subunit ribosomal protein SAe
MAANPLAPTEADVKTMLAAKVHIGTRNRDAQMYRYIWNRNTQGVNVINLGKTWEKLQLAARIIVAIENPLDVVAISARPWGQRAVFKFAQHTGCNYIGTRYTPGTFTNQMQKRFMEPRLLIVTDPLTDHQPLKESSYMNIPTIAFCDTDAPLRHVDVCIPCNNKSKSSIALMYWLLAREVNRLRGALARDQAWNVMVDLFMYRDPEEADKAADAKEKEAEDAAEAAQGDGYADDSVAQDGQQQQGAPVQQQAAGKVAEWGADHSAQAPVQQGNWSQAQAQQGGNWDAPAQQSNF